MSIQYRSVFFSALFIVIASFIMIPSEPQAVAAQETPAYSIFLPLVVNDSQGQRPSELVPTSYDKIQSGLTAKKIDLDTAARYSSYAAFGDSRLPKEFKGDDSDDMSANLALRWVQQEWAKLKPATQQELQAFFEPPTAAASWHAQSVVGPASAEIAQANEPIVWRSISDVNKPVKVWYQARYGTTDSINAQVIFDVANNKVWPELKKLFQQEPPSDVLTKNNGGDGRYDIYLVSNLTRTVSYGKCEDTPSYILLNNKNLHEANVATQLAFAFLYGYDLAEACSEYDWISAATAIWANDHIFASNQFEHQVASRYLDATQVSLNSRENSAAMAGRYLWPFFMARQLNNSDLIRKLWERNQDFNSLEAVNGVIPQGWEKHWPDFALNNWNKLPVDAYQQQDNLEKAAKASLDTKIQLTDGKAVEPIEDAKLTHLSSKYYRYTFGSDIRSVSFYNGWSYNLTKDRNGAYGFQDLLDDSAKDIRVQALVKVGGQWKASQDWSNRPLSFFCLDRQSERIEELVLVVSNSQWKDQTKVFEPFGEAPMITASNVACLRWEGNIVHTSNSAYKDYPGFSHLTVKTNVVWEALPTNAVDPIDAVWLPYSFNAVSGSINYEEVYERYVEGTEGPYMECGGKATGKKVLDGTFGSLRMTPVIFPDLASSKRLIEGRLYTQMDLTTPACEDGNIYNHTVVAWDLPEGHNFTVDTNGRRIQGSYSPKPVCDEWEKCEEKYTWDFVMRSEQ
jgi:hypothetical protein